MDMTNVVSEETKQQVLTPGRLGWSLRRIEQATRIPRETASAYLKAAGIAVTEKFFLRKDIVKLALKDQ